MAVVIAIILSIITLLIIGLILRKRIYDNVDELESWKLDIMNRNIAAQLSRIKSLNLSGETQEKFEAWKERWDYILTKELPDVEECLFDAEGAADRYRFSTAKKILHKIEEALKATEVEIDNILEDLEHFLSSEEKSRLDIEELQPKIKALQTKLTHYRYQYGKAERFFETELKAIVDSFESYEEMVEAGNYLEASQLVEQLKPQVELIESQIEAFPQLYKACKETLPKQLKDLSNGLEEMKEEGYRVEHLGFQKDIQSYEQRLRDCVTSLDKGNTLEIDTVIKELEERIQEMYQLLEKEAIAKSYIETKIPTYEKQLKEWDSSFQHTKEEVDELKEAYYFEDTDMEKYLMLEKTINQLNSQLRDIAGKKKDESISHTELRDIVEQGFAQLEELKEVHVEFQNQIQTLRKDEIEAKEKLADMREKMNDVRRRLKKSNVPGVPGFIWDLIEIASEKNSRVIQALETQPLDIGKVQAALTEARLAVDNMTEQTDKMLEQAYLTEQVIQYANRYRSRYPHLAAKLTESERLFRAYEYELSLEQAATAIEEVEPGSLKRIETNHQIDDII